MSRPVLVFSSFPPTKCGIGTYAAEHVLHLKEEGKVVYTCSPDDTSAANYRFDMYSVVSMIRLSLILLFKRFDAIHMHYTGDFIFPVLDCTRTRFIMLRLTQIWLFLVLGFKSGRNGSVIFHEAYAGNSKLGLIRIVKGLCFAQFKNLVFHTPTERARIIGAYPDLLDPGKAVVERHERHMRPKYSGTKAQARSELGVAQDATVFLCIGFIQEHKRFDLAVDAFNAASRPNSKLYVVGSIRLEKAEYQAYRDELARQIAATPQVELVERFVDDRQFDQWIAASDAVVLPYKEISSSGVGARASILGRDIIINAETNLKGQFEGYEGVLAYSTRADLIETFRSYQPSGQSIAQAAREKAVQAELSKPLLFVMPMFGKEVRAGAEGFIFSLCEELTKRGHTVEVWSSDSSRIDGRNHDFADHRSDAAVPFKIRRFPANVESERLFQLAHRRMCRWDLGGRVLGRVTSKVWTKTALTGVGMEEALEAEKDRFSSVHLCHYFGGSTHRLAGIAPAKTILHPFIHDEPQAFHSVMRPLFASARGVICNSKAEVEVALRSRMGLLPSRYFPIGNGVQGLEEADPDLPADRLRKKELVFIGRLIPEKNLFTLLDWVNGYNALARLNQKLTLNLIGEGPLHGHPKFASSENIHFAGWLSESEKRAMIRHAIAVVQPSVLESFSLVIMESWAEKTPVLVHKDCGPTSSFVKESSGGFAVQTQDEFNAAVDALWLNPSLPAGMGNAGFRFAKAKFSWEQVTRNFVDARRAILTSSAAEPQPAPKPPFRYLASSLELGPVENIHDLSGLISYQATPEAKTIAESLGPRFYADFERQFRDDNDQTKTPESWTLYASYAQKMGKSEIWVDIGAGRGLFLEYLNQVSGVDKSQLFGVEPDLGSCVELLSREIPGCSLDGQRFLDLVPDESIAAISLLHTAEHIPWQLLCVMLKTAYKKLRDGGVLILEFPNADTIKTSATNFWIDPTHIKPLVPVTVFYLLKTVGFRHVESHFFSPHFAPERMQALIEEAGEVVVRNLYGCQDACLLGVKTPQ